MNFWTKVFKSSILKLLEEKTKSSDIEVTYLHHHPPSKQKESNFNYTNRNIKNNSFFLYCFGQPISGESCSTLNATWPLEIRNVSGSVIHMISVSILLLQYKTTMDNVNKWVCLCSNKA